MWTSENRLRYERRAMRYPSDLKDEEFALVEPLITPAKRGGRRRRWRCLFYDGLSSHAHFRPPYRHRLLGRGNADLGVNR